jgi:2-oxoglutarate ferredoxin oxidoreductase subunit gamma
MDKSTSDHRIIIAGFGGQGILTLGKLLCRAAISEGKKVSYMPAYGTEVRGGTANCHVVISENRIFSPLVEEADSLLILNQLSYRRFIDKLRPSGLLVINSSLVDPSDSGRPGDNGAPGDCRMLSIPATRKAAELGNVIFANVLMLGAFVRATGICKDEHILAALAESLKGKKKNLLDTNREAYQTGAGLVAQQ